VFSGIGLIAFCCTFGAAQIGLFLGRRLPESNRTKATQKTVLNVMNLVSVLSALVLGLMIADTKANFDASSKEVEEFAANLVLLDRELLHFDFEIKKARDGLRAFTMRKTEQMWPKDRTAKPMIHDMRAVAMLDEIQEQLRMWTPPTEAQREGRANALQLITELKRTSRLLAIQEVSHSPPAFLIVVIVWLTLLFLSFALFAPLNATAIFALVACSISVSIAVNLIFDMDRPFAGFIRVSSTPMQQALDQMKP